MRTTNKKRRTVTRLLAGLMALIFAVVTAIGVLPAMTKAADNVEVQPVVPQNGLIAQYYFMQKPEDGMTVRNTAGGSVGDAVVQNESTAKWEDNALVFSGQGNSAAAAGTWVSLPDDILSGKTSATISLEVKADATMVGGGSFQFLWSIGNSGTQTYWFMNTRDPRTAITGGGNGQEKTLTALRCRRIAGIS